MADPEEPPPMQKDVHIIVQVIVRKGEPLPPPEKAEPLPPLENDDGEEVAGEGEIQDAEGNGKEEEEPSGGEGPKPSLEELGVKFVLSTFNGESLESDPVSFIRPEEEEAKEPEPEEEAQDDPDAPPKPLKGKKNGLVNENTWTYFFTFSATVNEDVAVTLCKTVESSINLMKADLDVPLVGLPLDLAPLVAGEWETDTGVSLATTELVQNPYNLADFTVITSIFAKSRPFLTPALEEKLNPLCITILAAEDMPDHKKYEMNSTWKDGCNPRTQSLDQLADTCKPVYCKYTFMPPESENPPVEGGELPEWNKEIITHSVRQARKVKFKHKKVFMAGLVHADDLFRHLKFNPLEIEVHDRDRIVVPKDLDEVEEEENEEGEAGQRFPVWSGLKSIDKARAEEALPKDPFAVCTVNLMPLCDGRKFLVERCNLWPKRIKYPDFSAHQRPLAGDYVDGGSVLIVKIDLCRPLKFESLYPAGPFQRVVYRFEYGNADLLEKLNETIVKINADALGKRAERPKPERLQELEALFELDPKDENAKAEYEGALEEYNANRFEPAKNELIAKMIDEGQSLDMLEKTLNSLEITEEQAQDPTLDIITGVQVIDSSFRIFILEGLKGAGILRLIKENPRISKNTKEFKMLYNPEITFEKRLYGGKYHVNIKKIKLRETLRQLILKVDTYLEPKYQLTAWALMRLNEISKAGRVKKLRDLVLFPEVVQLEHMYKKVGDVLSFEDSTGRKRVPKKKKGEEEGMPVLTSEELEAAKAMPRPKEKAPTDCQNPVYLQFLATKPPPADFVEQNMEAVRGEAHSPETLLEFGNDVHNYSTQFLNYGDMQKDFERLRYLADYGKVHYTYSKDLLSGAFVLVDPAKQAKKEKQESKARWLTKEGFQWPKARTPKELIELPNKLPSAGADSQGRSEFSYPIVETEWVDGNKLNNPYLQPGPTLTEGRKDFNIRYNTHARPFHPTPQSVFAAESGAALEEQERKTQMYQAWLNKLAVNDKRFHVLWNSGKGQVDRQKPLLKNMPTKIALKTLPKPEGCQLDTLYPASMFARDSYIDLKNTFVVDMYGVRLRFEDKSVDDESRVTRWVDPLAPGVRAAKEKSAIHTSDFRTTVHKPAKREIPVEKVTYRPIAPLSGSEKDRPTALYAHTYQRMGE